MTGRGPIGIALFLLAAGCGAEETQPAQAEKPGRYHDLVAWLRDAPLDQRMAVYLPLARGLDYAEKSPVGEPHLGELVDELSRGRDFASLTALEEGLRDPDRRRVFFEIMARREEDPQVRELLGRWARAHPGEVVLAIYRPGGVAFLFERLEDPAVHAVVRARCSFQLARTGDANLVPRMRALADDPTPVPLRSVRAGSGVPTLGEVVRTHIALLERNAAAGR